MIWGSNNTKNKHRAWKCNQAKIEYYLFRIKSSEKLACDDLSFEPKPT